MTKTSGFTVKIVEDTQVVASGKLADVELHFSEGPLAGLKLIGFALWQRRTGDGFNVTFPARQYSVNGERCSFALLRPLADPAASNGIRDLIIDAYRAHVTAASLPVRPDFDTRDREAR